MALNKFNWLVLAQILGIALVGLLAVLSLEQEYMRMTTAGLIFLWVGQILILNYYMNRIHRDVYKFMEALKNQDTSQLFMQKKQGRYFSRLFTSFNDITRNFRLVRIEKEAENQFFVETIKQSASGILAVAGDGKILLINRAALQFLGMEGLRDLSELGKAHPELAGLVSDDTSFEDQQTKIVVNGRMVQLALKAKDMTIGGTQVRIFSLLDITREMTQNEVEAWHKLIRVLNHEITNSVTPIHILSSSLYDLYMDGDLQISLEDMDQETMDRTLLGLKTIVKMSEGLKDFLNTYKSFTHTGEAVYSSFDLAEMLGQITSLLKEDLRSQGISVNIKVSPDDLQILADEKLINQVLINLFQNAFHAMEGTEAAQIQISASKPDDQVIIEFRDNGKGIPEDVIDHIFTPFFTTRKEGSGIGLSLARQIMLMHKGSISVDSREGEFTSFTLTF